MNSTKIGLVAREVDINQLIYCDVPFLID